MLEVALGKQTLVETSSVSETGPMRELNEDSIAVRQASEHNRPGKGTLLIVADGMGGMAAGEYASAMVTTDLPALYFISEAADSVKCLVQSLAEVNRRVHECNRNLESGKSMGTTVVASVIANEYLITANVGDSRAYLFRDGKLKQLSIDHCMRKEFFGLFDKQVLDYSHVLTQAIGPQASINPHVSIHRLVQGDRILLCSDGLTSVVTDAEISELLGERDLAKVLDQLLANVFAKGGDDNVSIILSSVREVVPATSTLLRNISV